MIHAMPYNHFQSISKQTCVKLNSMKQELIPFDETTKEEEHLILHFMTSEKCPYAKDGSPLPKKAEDGSEIEENLEFFDLSIQML